MKFRLLGLVCVVFVAVACGDSTDPGDGSDASTSAIDASQNQIDASSTQIDASSTNVDASNNPTIDSGNNGGNGVQCGDQVCNAPQICCTTQTGGGPGGSVTQECTTEADCQGAPASCDGAEDCDGTDVCCGSFGGGGGGGGGGASCGDPDGQGCSIVLCNDTGDCPGGTDQCCPSPIGGAGFCSSFGCF